MAQLLREVLEHRFNLYITQYGSLEAAQPATGDVLFGRINREEWIRFSGKPDDFKANLAGGRLRGGTEVGPLVTTTWHQGPPYNNSCPMGDGGRTVVGCVATATAQIMKYHNQPVSGTDANCNYNWDGDNSCDPGHNNGAGNLSVNLTDPYAWGNMPDDCTTGSPQAEQDAVAELCYEVGVALEMDYGVCGSGIPTSAALTVLRDDFGYDNAIDRENRPDHTPATWFGLIQAEINASRPILYRIRGHAIVCDGWRDTGGQNQYHMNYGWDNFRTDWYVLDNLHCPWQGCGLAEEYLIRNIAPPSDDNSPVLSNPCVQPYVGTISTVFTYTVHYYDPDGDPPIVHGARCYIESCGQMSLMTL